jgi:hypothetical protein
MGAGYLGFECTATAATGTLLQDKMLDVHLDSWQFDDLMGVVRRKRDEFAVATGTGAGLNETHLSWVEQGWTSPLISLFPAAFARRWPSLTLGFAEG